MKWVIMLRRPQSQFCFVCNSSVQCDDIEEAAHFESEDKAIAAMMEWNLSADDYFITEDSFPATDMVDKK